MSTVRNFCGFFLLLTLLLGCGDGASTDGQTGKPSEEKKIRLALIPKCMGHEFWKTVEEGARTAAEEMNVDLRWEGTVDENQISEQNKIIENMINLEVDGIGLAPLNPRAQSKMVVEATDAGIPVVIFDSAVDGDTFVSFIATDNEKAGVLGAEHLAGLLDAVEKPRVILFNFIQGTASCETRARGFKAGVGRMEIAASPYPEGATVSGCKKVAADTLERFVTDNRLEIDGIFACNDRATLGAVSALDDLRQNGVEVNVRIVGFDFSPKLNEMLLSGEIDALVVQDPYKMGYLTVKTLVEHVRGTDVPPRIDTGVQVATALRLKAEPALRKLMGMKE